MAGAFGTRPGVNWIPMGFEQITCAAATGLTPPDKGDKTIVAIIRCEAQSVRWRDDGTNPTAAIGIPMLVADPPLVYMGNLAALKFIESTATAKVNVAYYRLD